MEKWTGKCLITDRLTLSIRIKEGGGGGGGGDTGLLFIFCGLGEGYNIYQPVTCKVGEGVCLVSSITVLGWGGGGGGGGGGASKSPPTCIKTLLPGIYWLPVVNSAVLACVCASSVSLVPGLTTAWSVLSMCRTPKSEGYGKHILHLTRKYWNWGGVFFFLLFRSLM